ncbi:uncharacterized protein FA14DRAFT_175502 [Meira miltonrushii]|uniref:Uncharacterized protein n=1 Tax=Meira miltonrushii TaxID=1280837 RepID=A0A316V3N3_9BASI|nr:uncharacterized protein FA14DRAFT_175502 [Meira miltonrushii]PWN31864.1 hypothetical protein FA14DRAFT_175502 [Meira miltonrushii]
MIAFRYLSLMPFMALFFTPSTHSASILDPRGYEFDLDISVFVDEFIKLDVNQQFSVLNFFKDDHKPFGFSWSACSPYFPPGFRLPGCPPPPPEGCPIPPRGCRPPPPQWYCPKHKKPESAKNCPKPPPKPPICKPWQRGFYHLKPEDQHI